MNAIPRVVAFMAILAGPLRAANAPLTAELLPLTTRLRTEAPAFIDFKLHNRQREFLEGALEIQVLAGDEMVLRQETQELTLMPGISTHRLLLPPVPANRVWGSEARLRFLTRDGPRELGRVPLFQESMAERQYLIAVCGDAPAWNENRPRLWQVLRPERYLPPPSGVERRVVSTPIWLAPGDLPASTGLCAFDVVLLENAALSALSEKQFSQLATWVEAGGSLFVAPRHPLSAESLVFLNGLAGDPDAPPALLAEPGGKFSSREGPLLLRRPGLGRLVIALDPLTSDANIEVAAWRQPAMYLAHFRSEYVDLRRPITDIGSRYIGDQSWRAYHVQRRLLPLLTESTRMIPRSVIGAILGAFVLLIGPGEWFALGWLRRRRWTWLTFPACAAGFTLLTVRAAEHYLGRGDQRVALVVTDVGKRGRVLRENRLELWFAGRSLEAVSELRQALTVPCLLHEPRTESTMAAPHYEGQVPARYVFRQALRQWTPQLQRTLSFEPRTPLPGFRWEAIEARALAADHEPARYFAEQANALGWAVGVLHRGRLVDTFPRSLDSEHVIKLLSFVSDADGGSWAESLAPSGRADLLDLVVQNPYDFEQWLVVAERRVGREVQILRRVYRTDE